MVVAIDPETPPRSDQPRNPEGLPKDDRGTTNSGAMARATPSAIPGSETNGRPQLLSQCLDDIEADGQFPESYELVGEYSRTLCSCQRKNIPFGPTRSRGKSPQNNLTREIRRPILGGVALIRKSYVAFDSIVLSPQKKYIERGGP